MSAGKRLAAVLFLLLPVTGLQARAQEREGNDDAARKAQEPEASPYQPSPGSLWPGFDPYVDLVSDLRAQRVGDLVTIRIVENVRAKQGAGTDTDRKTDISAGISQLFGLQNYVPSELELDRLLGASSETSFSAGGQNTRTNTLNATITATVVEVLPNGNLVLEASRFIKVNEEEERLTLRGVVRRYDIGPRNEVLSTSVANAEIHYGGKGVIGSNLKPGLLFRLVRFLF